MKLIIIAFAFFSITITNSSVAENYEFRKISTVDYKKNAQLARFDDISAIAMDGADSLYIATEKSDTAVTKILSNGNGTAFLVRDAGKKLLGLHIAVDRIGTVYISDASSNSIEKISAERKIETIIPNGIGKTNAKNDEIKAVGALSVSENGEIYFFDRRVLKKWNGKKLQNLAGSNAVNLLQNQEPKSSDGFVSAAFISPQGITTLNGKSYIIDTGFSQPNERYMYQQFIEIDDLGNYNNVIYPTGIPYWEKTVERSDISDALSADDGTWDNVAARSEIYTTVTHNFTGHLLIVGKSGEIYIIKDRSAKGIEKSLEVKNFIELGLYYYLKNQCVLSSKDEVVCSIKNSVFKFDRNGAAYALFKK